MSEKGVIKQIIGAVIDVEFNKDQIPNIYDALVVSDNNLVMETQQQLGDGVVRTVAMGSTEGLKRGLEVSNTKAPISVPVGEATLDITWGFAFPDVVTLFERTSPLSIGFPSISMISFPYILSFSIGASIGLLYSSEEFINCI